MADAQHHTTNAVALLAPVLSWFLSLPAHITVIVGVLSIVYYAILIAKEICNWGRKDDG